MNDHLASNHFRNLTNQDISQTKRYTLPAFDTKLVISISSYRVPEYFFIVQANNAGQLLGRSIINWSFELLATLERQLILHLQQNRILYISQNILFDKINK